jgi:hypothetical protein
MKKNVCGNIRMGVNSPINYFQLISMLLASFIISSCTLQHKSRITPAISRQIKTLRNRDISGIKINSSITLDTILKGCPEDTARFRISDYVSITGFVLGIDEEPYSFHNSSNRDSASHNIRLFIGQSIYSWKDSVFVAELTKKYMALHPNLNPDIFIGRKIILTGYMMYNFETRQQALNAFKKSHKTDRKTAWEICPVTNIKIVEVN